MPLPSSRMTQQPARPTRYFPGKALAPDAVSDDDDEDESDDSHSKDAAPPPPPPKATSFPKKLAVDLKNPIISTSTTPASVTKPAQEDLSGFVTASESDEDESEEEEDEEEEEDTSSSSDDEPAKPQLAPKFISKAQRAARQQQQQQQQGEPIPESIQLLRQEKADAILQAQIEKDMALRRAAKKNWDDDNDDDMQVEVDDTDDLDPEAERAAWKLRELQRVRRDREALIAKEKEREEVEARRNMTVEEREAADQEYIAAQHEERESKGKMGFMQKYFHKGAFFHDDDMDDDVREALTRDTAGRKFVDDTADKSVLPEYMRIRDMTRLGKKGRTRYRDLKSEDTGRWGDVSGKKGKGEDWSLDERFRKDEERGERTTGANDVPVGERRRREGDEVERMPKKGRFE